MSRFLSSARPLASSKLNTFAASLAFSRAMHIQSIPMWVGSSNNYAYLVKDDKSKDAVIIDPAHPEEVVPVLKKAIQDGEINLTAIVNTHHHWDHAGGNKQMLSELGKLPIYGGKECEGVTSTPSNGDGFKLGNIKVKGLYTPCHTQDSICWYMEDGDQKVVFTGDTLFHGGCGRFFEGTATEMHKALNKTLAALSDDTRVYPGHEYTKANVKFGVSVLQNEAIKALESFAENNKETQGQFTIGDEKKHNVFMRVDDPEIQKATGQTDPVEVMAKLREMKNNFKSSNEFSIRNLFYIHDHQYFYYLPYEPTPLPPNRLSITFILKMMSSSLGACLLAALPAQVLALPATFTSTAADTQASWAPTITPSNMCKDLSYDQATGHSGALTADCRALREAVNNANGLWTLDAVSTDYTWTVNTTNTCTVAVENPNLRSDGLTRIGNADVVRILDHVLANAGDTVEGKGNWWCGGDGSSATPKWWIHNAAPAAADDKPPTAPSSIISSVISKAKDLLQRRDGASETAPWTSLGGGPATTCGNSTYTDLTNDDTSPYWWWCDDIVGWVSHNDGEWTLTSGGSDDWWRLENAMTDKCELVVKNSDGSPSVGNNDALTLLRYIQFDKDRAKGQKAEFQGSFACGAQQTTVEWWLRKVQT